MRRNLALAFLLLLAMIGAPAQAGQVQPFSLAAFKAAQAQGLPILVDVHADWCPICHLQGPTIAKLAADPAFAKLVILRLDYDKQVAEKQALGVRRQSTLIAFHGTTETGRSIGVTDAPAIATLARSALSPPT